MRQPVGTGPFKLKEAVKGSHVTVEAYAGYHGGAPKLRAIAFKVIPDVNRSWRSSAPASWTWPW